MTNFDEDFGSVVEYLMERGYEVDQVPLFDTKAGHTPSQLHTKIGPQTKVLYCCKTAKPEVELVAAFTEMHDANQLLVKDLNAFIAFKAQEAGDFAFSIPRFSAKSTVKVDKPECTAAWGEAKPYELVFSESLSTNWWFKARIGGWPYQRANSCYAGLPTAYEFNVAHLAVLAVAGGPAPGSCTTPPEPSHTRKMKKLVPFIAANPHCRQEELEMMSLMSRHRVSTSFNITSKKQVPGEIRLQLAESGVLELGITGSLMSSFDLTALVSGTGVSVLHVRSTPRPDSFEVMQAAFSLPEEASELTVFKVAVTAQSIDVVCQLLLSHPKRLDTLVILNNQSLTPEHFSRVLRCSEFLRCVRIHGQYEARLRASEFQALLTASERYPHLQTDLGVGCATAGPLPPALTESTSAPKDSLVFVVGHKKYVPCSIIAARSYSLLVEQLLECGEKLEDREITIDLDHPVSTEAVSIVVVFVEKCATLADHHSALSTEGHNVPPYLPSHHFRFANQYILPLPGPKAYHFLCEMLELATYLNIPVVKRFVRSTMMLLLAEGRLDAMLL